MRKAALLGLVLSQAGASVVVLETGVRGQGVGGRPLSLDFGLKSLVYNETRGGLAVDLWAIPDNLHSVELGFHDQDMRPVKTCPAVVLCAAPPQPLGAGVHMQQQGPELVEGWPTCGAQGQHTHTLEKKEMTLTEPFKPLRVWHASPVAPGPFNIQVSLPRASLSDCGVEVLAEADQPNVYAGRLCVRFKYATKEGFKGNNFSSTTLESCHLLTVEVPPAPQRSLRGAALSVV